MNGPHGGCIGPHISPCIRSKNVIDSLLILAGECLMINLPWEQAEQENSLGRKIFWFFNECSHEFVIIFYIITE